MKIVTTTVGCKGPEGEGQNYERLTAAKRALDKATNLGADLIILPGGYFTAHSAQARNAIAQSLVSTAKEIGIAVIFGVDQQAKNPKTDWEILSKGLLLPCYGYAWSSSESEPRCWQQRSSTSDNQWYVSNTHCSKVRLLTIGDESVAVLMCGEIFNQRIRQYLANRQPRPKVVVDVAHVGSGFRIFQGMKVLAKLGLPSVCSVHVQREYAVKHRYDPPGKRLSSTMWDDYVYGPPRIELKLWKF